MAENERSATAKKRERSLMQGALNAINRGLIETPMLPWELSKKLVSLAPGVPAYSFGSDTEAALRKAQDLGVLTDRDMAAPTGYQKLLEDTLRTGAGGLGFGTMLRAPKAVMEAGNLAKSTAASSPVLREQLRQLGLYDVGIPMAVEPGANFVENRLGEGAGTATRVLGPLVASGMLGMRMYGDLGRTESALRRAERRTGSPMALRAPEGSEGLRVSVPEMIQPASNSIRDQAANAYRKAAELRNVVRSPQGARNLQEARNANLRTIEGMPFENVSVGEIGGAARNQLDELGRVIAEAPTEGLNAAQLARQAATRIGEIAQGLYNRLPGSGGGFERMGNRIYDLMEDVQNWKNQQWRNLGDARDDVFVNAQPLRDGESALRAIHGSSAMPESTASPIMRDIRNTFESLYRGAEARNAAAQERVLAERRALLLPTDGQVNVSQNIPGEQIRIGDLRQRYRELNDMWQSASPSERMLISRLKKSINDTLEQDPQYGQMWQQARESNVFYKDLTDPSSVYGKAFADTNIDRGRQYLADHVRKVFTGPNAGGQADELADLFSRFSTPDELQNLFRGALGDTIALKARKLGAIPEEVPGNIRSARGELNAARSFAERIGIPLDELDTMGQQLTIQANAAEPRMKQLRELADNPREFVARAVTGTPEQVAQVRNTLQDLSAVDPTLVQSIDNGITRAADAHAQQTLTGQDLGKLSKDPFMFVSQAVGGRPDQKAKVASALEASMPSPMGPSKAAMVENDIARAERAAQAQAAMDTNLRRAGMEDIQARGLTDADLANMGALGGAAMGANPFTIGRATRAAEAVANRLAHPLTDTSLYGELLSDPSKYFAALQQTPLYAERGVHKLLPQAVTGVNRAYSPTKEMVAEEAKQEAAAVPFVEPDTSNNWIIDDEEEPTSGPLLKSKSNQNDGWIID